jgi:flavin reductase (DIM6/NTAB) family NADH-FMN oxidoreductase RutF
MIVMDEVSSDTSDLRRAFGCFPSGVTAVCALTDGTPVGMAASSFTAVSIAPPLVSVCVQLSSTTWPKLRTSNRLGISVLAQDQHLACTALAMKQGDRFAGLSWQSNQHGALFLEGGTAWLECSLHSELPAGDHTIVLLEIHSFWTNPVQAPLVFHASQFHQLAKIA